MFDLLGETSKFEVGVWILFDLLGETSKFEGVWTSMFDLLGELQNRRTVFNADTSLGKVAC